MTGNQTQAAAGSLNELVTTIKKVLGETELVLGWTIAAKTGVASPAHFLSEEQAEQAVFDATCVHNLAVHLPRLKDKTVGIVAKGCDVNSIVELIIEHEVKREQVKVIAVSCPAMLDVKGIWRRFGYGAAIEDRSDGLYINGGRVERGDYLERKCRGCRDSLPVISDETIGTIAPPPSAALTPEPSELKAEFAAMSPAERQEFWRQQFERCIRCNACRDVCPMCFCRNVCTMQTRDPHWTGGEVNAKEAEMAQMVRISHLAGRCTGCGECERACPVGIPLMLYLDEQNRVIEELFDYRAGTDLEARPPLQIFDIKEPLINPTL